MISGRPARLVFFGSDEIALPALDAIRAGLNATVEITAVFSQPDRPSGRGKVVRPNAVSAWALERGIPLHRPEKLDEHTPALLRELGCDIALVMAYGHILKRALLDTPEYGFFNLHGSLLPRFRGATPIEGALVAGDPVTGVSLQRVVPKLDAGDVVDSASFPLTPTDTTESVRQRIAEASVAVVRRALPAILAGRATFAPQDDALVSHTRKISRDDAALDFHTSARELAARVRALHPWPGVTVDLDGATIKIGRADVADIDVSAAPGTVTGRDRDALQVATGDGVLRLLELQRPGGKMLPAAAFLAGHPVPVGTVLASRPMTPLVGRDPFKVAKKPEAPAA